MASIRITKLDFVPKRGRSYNINWPGPPRRLLRYADVKHFKPLIELKTKAPIGFLLMINVKEYREAWGVDELVSDIELTYFTARFEVGKRIPTEIKMVNHIKGPPRDPGGSPRYTFGSFWLGASKRGRIRGNIGTGDDRHARVYLELFSLWVPEVRGYQLTGKKKSRKYRVRAI
ncbi:MAG: hypothetical protein JSV33_06005 [bacterium]|nr:MAG: hypothetical protein JSV33_06005 [bacterium]